MLGLQGSGKTTSSAKLARWLTSQGRHPMLVSTDVRRPAAIEQLSVLAKQVGVRAHDPEGEMDPVVRATGALASTKNLGFDTLIVDTAGRLHIDDELMVELEAIKSAVEPSDLLYVADAMTGQDAVKSAGEFNHRIGVSGVVLTKMDGDARGGAALSVREVTGVPIKFLGAGEKTDALEPFYPDRLATRILGMGDVMTLIEKAREQFDEQDAAKMQKKMATASFNLEDFLSQMRSIKKMGPLTQLMEMIPGMGQALRDPQMKEALEGDQMKMAEAIILSMTLEERRNPDILSGSRKRRIAAGSGTTPQDVNQLLTSFKQSQKMMKQVMGMQNQGRKGRRGMLGGMGGMGGVPGLPGGRGPFGI
jgi:signal recognition particle subunit SRP54